MSDARLTRRQRIVDLLAAEEMDFHALRQELEVPVHVLKEDLEHVRRSTGSGGGPRLRIEPPRCPACGFLFRGRTQKHLHPPSRCPECRNERIQGPFFRVG